MKKILLVLKVKIPPPSLLKVSVSDAEQYAISFVICISRIRTLERTLAEKEDQVKELLTEGIIIAYFSTITILCSTVKRTVYVAFKFMYRYIFVCPILSGRNRHYLNRSQKSYFAINSSSDSDN